MVSNQRYYSRRAAEERMAAARAISDEARQWHQKLAESFSQRALGDTMVRSEALSL